MDNGSYTGQTLDVVFALREAHNSVSHTVLWPTPQEDQHERRRAKKRRGDSRDRADKHRGGCLLYTSDAADE